MAPINYAAASKTKVARKYEEPSLFHKPQKRAPLTPVAVNTSGNKVEKIYDMVKPTFKFYTTTIPVKVGCSTRYYKRKVPAPKEVITFRQVDKDALNKPLVDLTEKAKAEKKKEMERLSREVDELFESDSENSLPEANNRSAFTSTDARTR